MNLATQDLVPGVTDLLPGSVLDGKYRIERLIARGGMGAVFAAHHLILGQTVAIKVLLPEHAARPGAAARFMNEARAVARLKSEHIAAVMDIGQLASDCAYMVLEYLEGDDLDDVVKEGGPQPISDSVRYILQALEAIAQAHSLGIIHRDLKPANLFLTRRPDGSPIIKVLDFGISKVTTYEADASENLTATNAIMGSPASISPEQLRNSKRVDARTDIWAVGVILYHLLAGRLPFTGESFGELFSAILELTPPRITTIRAEVPTELDDIVFRCLERDRDARYETVAELAVALAPFGPADAAVSVERICRTLGKEQLGAAPPPRSAVTKTPVTVDAVAIEPPSKDVGGTNPSLPPNVVTSLFLPTIAGIAAGALVVGLLVMRLRSGHDATKTVVAVAPPPPSASESPAATTVPAPPPETSAAPAAMADSAVAPASNAPMSSAPVPSAHATPSPGGGARGGGHAKPPTSGTSAKAVDDSILLQRN